MKRKLSELNDAELTKVAQAIEHVEGTVAGQTYKRDDPHLPKAVHDALGTAPPAPDATHAK